MKVQGGLNGATSERDGATELFARHSAEIYRYCLRRLREPEEAEDALQTTYLNAWRRLKEGFQPENPRPWLFQIAANVCTSTVRAKLGGTRLELRDPETLENLVQVEEAERDALLDLTEAVRELPDRQRRALVLRDWQGLAYDEIAARMAVSDAAVETLLFRARSKVAATLASREWRPKLATSARALLVWPLGLLPTKSAVASSSAHLKAGLVLACGTVAPLVAFGVLQVVVFGPEETKAARPGTVFAPAPQVEDPAARLAGRALPVAAESQRREERRRALGGQEVKGRSGSGHQSDAPTTAQAATHGPVPPSHAEPPADPHQGQVVLCHRTQSGKRPGVTINVAPQAAQHGLSQDPAGACG
jgi:RNA polymerase sigma-70 factor, ECF subfamily